MELFLDFAEIIKISKVRSDLGVTGIYPTNDFIYSAGNKNTKHMDVWIECFTKSKILLLHF